MTEEEESHVSANMPKIHTGPIICQVVAVKSASKQFKPDCACEDAGDVSPDVSNPDTCYRKPPGGDDVVDKKKKGNLENPPPTQQTPRRKSKGKNGQKNNPLKSQSSIYGITFNPTKTYNFGERGSGTKSDGPPQDYSMMLNYFLDQKTLFEDPEFPAHDYSLFFDPRTKTEKFEWKRPHELVKNPQFFVEGYSRFDIQQGELGDCWLLAATANLTMYKKLFTWVVPDDQDFGSDYAGLFHFRFWHYGRWIDVSIDDRLPTVNDELVFLHSTEANEFWSALLEKAYAKLHGCYDALKGGSTSEAMEDFTSGVIELYEIKNSPKDLFDIMKKAYERHSLMACSIEADPNVTEAQTASGLVRGHAYSITKVKHLQLKNVSGRIPMVRLRNPWGNEMEWNGAWSDGADEWNDITEEEKTTVGLNFDDDGEFWMAYSDFCANFDQLELCNLNPDSLSEEDLTGERNKKWEMSMFEGEWVKGVSAGGCRNFMDTFWHNPQYRVTLKDVDENDDEKKCTIIVALMQKHRRQKRAPVEWLTIGFAIYQLHNPDNLPKPLDHSFFNQNQSVGRSQSFVNIREVSCRFKLPPGTYCIVPSTYDPDEEGEFLVRVFSEHSNDMAENEKGIERAIVEYEVLAEETQDEESLRIIHELYTSMAGDDEELGWNELKEILDRTIELGGDSMVSKETCRSMIATVDYDRSGKLNFQELSILWCAIRRWKKVFEKLDTNDEGVISGYQFKQALERAGYTVNTRIMNMLMHRYGDYNRNIGFEDFVLCAIRLKTMIDTFEQARENDQVATFYIDEFIESTMYS